MLKTRSICLILFVTLFSSFALAKTVQEPVKLISPSRVMWLITEQIDGVDQATLRAPDIWEGKLAPLMFVYMDKSDAKDMITRCPLATLKSGKLCKEVGSADTDLLISGMISGKSRKTSPNSTKIGMKISIDLSVFRVDTNEKLFDIKLKSYATSENELEAYKNALEKITRPFTLIISNRVNVFLEKQVEGTIRVTGFKTDSEREDIMTSLRFIKHVKTVFMSEAKLDYAIYKVGYMGTLWGGLVSDINRTQGAGVDISLDGKNNAVGTYKADKAFRLMTAVPETADKVSDPEYDTMISKVPALIEEKLAKLDYVSAVKFPVRLPPKTRNAIKDMKRQYGGDLVFASHVKKKKGELVLTIELWTTFAGRLVSVSEKVESDFVDSAVSNLMDQIQEKLPNLLSKKARKMPKLRRSQFSAWKETTGF